MKIHPSVVCPLIALFTVPFDDSSHLQVIELPVDIDNDYVPLVQTAEPITSYATADAVLRKLGLKRSISSSWNVRDQNRWQYIQSFVQY